MKQKKCYGIDVYGYMTANDIDERKRDMPKRKIGPRLDAA